MYICEERHCTCMAILTYVRRLLASNGGKSGSHNDCIFSKLAETRAFFSPPLRRYLMSSADRTSNLSLCILL